MVSRREPNARLRALLAEAGWTGQDLARAVNAAGAESGLTLGYDRTSVAHWLAGSRPPEAVARMVAETLARRLRRRVDLSDTALARPSGQGPTQAVPEREEDIVARLVELAGGGRRRRTVLGSLVYSVSATALPDFTGAAAPRAAAERRADARDVLALAQSAELMLDLFASSDAESGGGRARPALSAYLAADIAPFLGRSVRTAADRRLMRAAARLTYLAGYMCFDENLGGAAQAYYRTSARLFARSGDLSGYTTTLRALSIQAHHLGHHAHARDLAEAAAGHLPALPSGQGALLSGQLAVTSAATGDRRAALSQLSRAHRLLDHGQDAHGTIGAFHPAALAHQEAEVLAAGADRAGAVAALTASLRHRPAAERRARALTTAQLAELQLDLGRLEQACATWHGFLDDRPHLHSARIEDALTRLRARLRPHRHQRTARILLDRSRAPGHS
ncbi:hypothetical protein ABUW04_20105 [Streptacidiphilus sp. N1-10]|uniref:Transcriptional regulator n=1 Tax=Streptacidiphilus jeojiensis TaxID=3229225 RepID=A0ABV6XRL4_9ACTN